MKSKPYILYLLPLFLLTNCGKNQTRDSQKEVVEVKIEPIIETIDNSNDVLLDELPTEIQNRKWVEIDIYDNQYWISKSYASLDKMTEVETYKHKMMYYMMEPIDFKIKDVTVLENNDIFITSADGFPIGRIMFRWIDKKNMVAEWKMQNEDGYPLHGYSFDKLTMETEKAKNLDLKLLPRILYASSLNDEISDDERIISDIDRFIDFHVKNDGETKYDVKNFILDYNEDGLEDRISIIYNYYYIENQGCYKSVAAKQNEDGTYQIEYIASSDGMEHNFSYTDKITLARNDKGFKCTIGNRDLFDHVPIFEYDLKSKKFNFSCDNSHL